ncbi:hypothetical protein GCM10029992_14250 [Glycomyces albus]
MNEDKARLLLYLTVIVSILSGLILSQFNIEIAITLMVALAVLAIQEAVGLATGRRKHKP